jgi:hypothetical protein
VAKKKQKEEKNSNSHHVLELSAFLGIYYLIADRSHQLLCFRGRQENPQIFPLKKLFPEHVLGMQALALELIFGARVASGRERTKKFCATA